MIENIAGYEIKHLVERWGEEELYLAHQGSMHRDVMLRVLDADNQPERADRFLEDARRLAAVDHPNVARLHEAGRERNFVFCSMEYPGQDSLDRALSEGGRLSAGRTVETALGVLEALTYVGERGLVHGALRPKVVFVIEGRVKVAGFGAGMPREIMLLGDAIQFLSPEHVSGGRLDTRSDIYSLGMIMYRALSGRLPFSDIDPRAVMRRQVEEMPRPLAELGIDAPAPLSAVVQRAIEKDPRLRYQKPAEMKDALSGVGEPEPPEPAPQKRAPKSKRRRGRH